MERPCQGFNAAIAHRATSWAVDGVLERTSSM
jgi:hypothetical protein